MQCTLKGYIDQQKIWTSNPHFPDFSQHVMNKPKNGFVCMSGSRSFEIHNIIARTNFLYSPPPTHPNTPRLFLYMYLVHTGHIHTFLGFPEVGHLQEPERITMVNCCCNNMKTLIPLEYCMDHKKHPLQLTLHRLYSFLM